MEQTVIDVSHCLGELCNANAKCSEELQSYLAKQIWTPEDRQNLLSALSRLFLYPDCTVAISQSFRSLILDIVERCQQGVSVENFTQYQKFCVALSKVVNRHTDVLRFTLQYLKDKPPFCDKSSIDCGPSNAKKAKKSKSSAVSGLELIQACYRLVRADPAQFRELWDWSSVLDHLHSDFTEIRWFAALCCKMLMCMTDKQTQVFLKKHFAPQKIRQLTLRHDDHLTSSIDAASLLTNHNQHTDTDSTQRLSHTLKCVTDSDLCDKLVSVCGVLLPVLTHPDYKQAGCSELLVPVASTQRNLRSLALAVASCRPVLLQGPVGCSKTLLVEHLAQVTGHNKTPYLMKVQLGDQTDSKALLGTYRCTDIPGEFVWQAGSLTQAITQGHWILLEDIDYAPMDVISVLIPILESGTLSLPGHGDEIKAAPGFRLFATQRLLGGAGGGGYYKQNSSSALLEKMWTKINVEPLSRRELEQVIVTKYPPLSTVVDRLLDIYFLLSAGGHEMTSGVDAGDDQTSMDVDSVGKFLSKDGRLISTRDLMKWCSRIVVDFDIKSTATGNKVFQEALDIFCACLSKMEKRLAVAEAVGAQLNITKVKAEYYCEKYKPNIEITQDVFSVGRATLPLKISDITTMKRSRKVNFAFTRQAVSLLERVAVCVARNEPVLLVGETGTGKTSSVQYLAAQMGHTLRVVNMNQQSDSTDLLGGFKPVDVRCVIAPVREQFEMLFCKTFSRKQNAKFLQHIQECFSKKRWTDLFKLMEHSQQAAVKKFEKGSDDHSKWHDLGKHLKQVKIQAKHAENALAFSFIEGTLVKSLKNGEWVLLDEINLATAETLECLSGLLESTAGSVVLSERGDVDPIVRHKDFRLFACMNPATDVGKKDLPPGIRNRFTELYMEELTDTQDLKVLVADYLRGLSLTAGQLEGIVNFYLLIKSEAAKRLTDGTGHKPHYSLRTLCRALIQVAGNPCGNVPRSLYEGFCLSFLTQLDRSSHPVVDQLIRQHVVGKSNMKTILKQPIPAPSTDRHVEFEGYWVSRGKNPPHIPDKYVLTSSVRENLRDLVRVVSAGRYPVLLQGETSVGKTSLVQWLARASGNYCVRVNNHEHTDLQEYIGCYSADEHGKLVFKEGVLVEAMRKGHWIILDELNLAPSDVLEALNRLLDDNRELFIPETQETVKAHRRFMLFATQNPPGQYGGRKILSRAFRNRFVELHFDEIPSKELQQILHQRCSLPQSYCTKLVAVMLDLWKRRRGSGVFAGKQGYITLRDLFRWAERYRLASADSHQKYYDWDQHLAYNGYMLLAGRVRKTEECLVIQEVIEKHLKRKVNPDDLFTLTPETSAVTSGLLQHCTASPAPDGFDHLVWTYSMRRLAVLVGQALKFSEPVLLVGDTGCGKTTICQLFAAQKEMTLYSVNCHQHTESSDFLGGLRPVRHRQDDEGMETQRLFEWLDGPLVRAMQEGGMLLVDEISLTDDSVLERLNSVLEPERRLLLAEKGSGLDQDKVEEVVATETFRIFATMNPGGDYGKKELSPALRNRFTEIWCPQSHGRSDLTAIIEHNLKSGIHLCNQEDGTSGIGHAIMDFVEWFSNNEIGKRSTVSIRDILSWVRFINTCSRTIDCEDEAMDTDDLHLLEPALAYIHGACLVFLDALGSGVTSSSSSYAPLVARTTCMNFLCKQIESMTGNKYEQSLLGLQTSTGHSHSVSYTGTSFGIPPFFISKGDNAETSLSDYALQAPTTCQNGQRVLRAMQLHRPILLEGSPGVGKTSLVSAIAKASGHQLVRINLSEQTDVTDLFGADLPVEGAEGGHFAWRDGPLLQALKAGHWIVLDELNLASQSVLEGLNACLDHRAEVYVPELGMTFRVQHEKTRLFACQNPLNQGGGRKGLPKSFLNRFTQVYVEPLSSADLHFITTTMYPTMPQETLMKMVEFNTKIYQETTTASLWGQRGAPWEFNLRDIFRWCDLMLKNQSTPSWNPGEYVSLVYADRMRTSSDKAQVKAAFIAVFGNTSDFYESDGNFHITSGWVQVGHSFLSRSQDKHQQGIVASTSHHADLRLLHHSLSPLESLMKVIKMNWMAILVGPSCSGKTSLVQLLAQLTGQKLQILAMNSAMDTTELLGGFEQADIKRHLEAVNEGLLRSVGVVLRWLLCHASGGSVVHDVRSVMRLQAKYTKMCATVEEMSSKDEADSLRQKFSVASKLVVLLQKTAHKYPGCPQTDNLNDHLCQIDRLEKKFMKEGSSSGGGQFEWVDSVLVHALTNGNWLLVDNVNFCSASVLDRLNALLEPGGVLSVNERGVIDGQIPTIKPHPNFRLILSMDPHHGEISRAMRNRGVEIYVLGEDEGGIYNDFDVKQMLQAFGMVGPALGAVLISVHREIRTSVMGSNHHSLLDLLHVAAMTQQQLERGFDLQTSLMTSAINVYVRGQRSQATKEQTRMIVEKYIVGLDLLNWETENQESSLMEMALWPVCAPSASDYCHHAAMATMRHHGTVLLHLLDQLYLSSDNRLDHSLTFQGLFKAEGKFTTKSKTGDIAPLIKTATWLLLERSSPQHWQIIKEWLLASIKRRFGQKLNQIMANCSGPLEKFTHSLQENVETIMSAMFTHPLMAEVTALYEGLTDPEQGDFDVDEQPFDLRWNPLLLSKLQRRHADVSSDRWQRLGSITNQIILVGSLAEHSVTSSLELPLTNASITSTAATVPLPKARVNSAATTLLRLSKAFHQGTVELERLPHPSVAHLHTFCNLLHRDLQSIFIQYQAVDDGALQQIQECLQWFIRFTEFCHQPIKKGSASFLPQLQVHWGWLHNKTLRPLFSDDRPMSSELQSVTQKLHQLLGSEDSAAKQQLVLWSSIGHPIPPRSQVVIQFLPELIEMSHHLPKVDTDHMTAVRRKILDLFLLLKNIPIDQNLDEEKTEELMIEIRNSLPTGSKLSCPDQTSAKKQTVTAIHEHLSVLTYFHLVQSLLSSQDDVDLHSITGYVNHGLAHTSLSPQHFAHMAAVTKNMDKERIQAGLWQILVDVHTLWSNSGVSHLQTMMMSQAETTQTDDVVHKSSHRDGSNKTEMGISLLSPVQSVISFRLMTDVAAEKQGQQRSADAFMPGSIDLGQFSDKVDELKSLSSQMWIHAANHSSSTLDIWQNEKKMVAGSFKKLCDAMFASLPYEQRTQCLDSLGRYNATVLVNTEARSINELCEATAVFCDLFANFKEVFKSCLHLTDSRKQEENKSSSDASNEKLSVIFTCGLSWAHVGMLQALLLAPRGAVDPAEKQALKLNYVNDEISSLEIELRVRHMHSQVLRGRDLDLNHTHPHVQGRSKRAESLQGVREQLQSMTAVRPTPPQYDNILRSVTQYVRSIGSGERTLEVITGLQRAYEMCDMLQPPQHLNVSLMKAKSWLSNLHTFITKMQNEFPLYADVLMPFLAGVAQMAHGIARMIYAVETKSARMQMYTQIKVIDQPELLEWVVCALGQMPMISRRHASSLDLAQFLSSDAVVRLVTHVLGQPGTANDQRGHHAVISVKKVMWSCLLHLRNLIMSEGALTSASLLALSRLLHLYVLSWHEAETRKHQKEAEEASLYRYKAQSYGSDLTEDEQNEEDLRLNFPSFHQDFDDITVGQIMDDKPEQIEEPPPPSEEMLLDQLCAAEMTDICSIHTHIFTTMTQTHWWAQPPGERNVNYVEAFMSGYQVAAALVQSTASMLSSGVDGDLLGGHLLMSAVLQNMVKLDASQKSPVLQFKSQRPYDIYHDPNVSEVSQCRVVLETFSGRVTELLQEWPDHPALKQLLTVINRILCFTITSPLMKFLTGLEVLLEKAQEWEKVASKHVTLQTHLTSVTGLVIQWRKLELKCWRGCLDVTQWRASEKAARFWFHIYQLIESYTSSQEDTSAGDTQTELIRSIQRFMESSSLGEYHTRLTLLLAFHCQATHMTAAPQQAILVKLLWNAYRYYSHFTPSINATISRLRAPIEKDLKGFVKIARWTDINYWAMKQAAEKTHRTLHKHMKKFESVLRQSVSPVLTEGKDMLEVEARSEDDLKVKVTDKEFLTSDHVMSLVREDAEIGKAEGTLRSLASVYVKMRKHCRRIIQADQHTGCVGALNQFTGDLISSVHDLQALQVTQSADKDKQKKEAKHIHLRKRKALADLFKYLAKLGLSYRKGLGMWKDADRTSLRMMLVDPVDVNVAFQSTSESSLDQQTVAVWDGCQHYYTRCMVRRALYHSALNAPSQELGVANLDRCRGFTEHLMKLSLEQRSQLGHIVAHFVSLRESCESIRRATESGVAGDRGLPPQSSMMSWLTELKALADQAEEAVRQFEVILHCCPEAEDAGGAVTITSPLPRMHLPQVAAMRRSDQMWTTTCDTVQKLLSEISSVKSWYDSLKTGRNVLTLTWNVYEDLRSQFVKLRDMIPVLESINISFAHPKTAESSTLTQCLVLIKQNILDKSSAFQNWTEQVRQTDEKSDSQSCDELTEFQQEVEKVIMEVLLVVQRLVKGQGQSQEDETANQREDSGEDDDELVDDLLVGKLHDSLNTQWTALTLEKISGSMEYLILKLKDLADLRSEQKRCDDTGHALNLLMNCMPAVDQYLRLTQFYLTQFIGSHRSTTKLLSVLLNVFTELTIKGFCLPAEYSDEVAGEGAGQFEDIEGGGLGEGEGMKDVSDQIENEDQLDEARKAGEEKDAEDPSQQPDIPDEDNGLEMSEDFDGKLHDMETAEGGEDSDEEDKQDENELDKQMGEVDDSNADKLDDQVWGSDDEDDQKDEQQDGEEESGLGSGKQSETELVAKDDNEDKTEKSKEQTNEEQKDAENEENDDKQKPHEQENVDESEYDENQVDPHYGEQPKQEEVQPMDLPDDLNLDQDEEGGEQQDATAETEENPFDVDKIAEQEEETEMKEEKEDTDGQKEEESKEDESMDVDKDENTEDKEKDPEVGSEDAADKKDAALDAEEDEEDHKDAEDKGDLGFDPQDDAAADEKNRPDNQVKEPEDTPESAERYGQTDHSADNAEQSDVAHDRSTAVSQDDREQEEGTGQAEAEDQKGQEGQSSSVTRGGTAPQDTQEMRQKPGQSNVDRSLGSTEEKIKRRLKTTDTACERPNQDEPEPERDDADLYEHIKDAASHHDAQTLDAATAEQEQHQQPVVNPDQEDEKMEDENAENKDDDDVQMMDVDQPEVKEKIERLPSSRLKASDAGKDEADDDEMKEQKVQVDGDVMATHSAQRPLESTIHTDMQIYMEGTNSECDLEKLRTELEQQLCTWSHPAQATQQEEQAALEAWHQYEALTSSLSQELCEQLRLVLEPSQATKLKGDYRTGKRLNMRKVIPYIASQFRKDKIWLRRTKPHKRQYQIMVAIDDSSSMMDNHSKQLAFESLSVISNALTLLEAGELAVCSFGESVELLHPFHEQFTSHSGSRILQRFTFEQKKTKIAELLRQVTGIMLTARGRQGGASPLSDTSQLLLVVSDGRGLFLEGMEVVKTAVRQAREANVFLVFVIIDNPENKDSILDIRVPFFKSVGQIPEIHSYMDHFPFPFYIILRDINSLPNTLSDALRQWFELVTASDK